MPTRLIGAYTEIVVWVMLTVLLIAGILGLTRQEELRKEEVKAKMIYLQFLRVEDVLKRNIVKTIEIRIITLGLKVVINGTRLKVIGDRTWEFNLTLYYTPTVIDHDGLYRFEKRGVVEVEKL